MENQQNEQKLYKKRWFKIAVILLAVIWVFGLIADDSGSDTAENQQNEQTNTTAPTTLEGIASANIATIGATKFSFKDVSEMSSENLVMVNVRVDQFVRPETLIGNSGDTAAKIYKAINNSEFSGKDISVTFYADKTDQYGNVSESMAISYTMPYATYEKINWDNFNAYDNLCNLLRSEPGGTCFISPALQ